MGSRIWVGREGGKVWGREGRWEGGGLQGEEGRGRGWKRRRKRGMYIKRPPGEGFKEGRGRRRERRRRGGGDAVGLEKDCMDKIASFTWRVLKRK